MAEPKVSIPITIRPRSTPNAELNAQNRERVVREITGETAPEVKDVPIRGYAKGGQVGKVGGFGLKRSKPDFAGGGSMLNRRSFTKPGNG